MSRKETPKYYVSGLRDVRQRHYLSQAALAAASQVSVSAIKYLEAKRRPASAATLQKLAAALGVAPQELLSA